MMLRGVLAFAALSLAGSAHAGEYLKPEEAKLQLADKLFSYTCFEGTSGAGRIHADGSVVGTIRFQGRGPSHFVALPANTIRVSSASICASMQGLLFQPCFNVEKIDDLTYRGSISGFGFAYCEFKRRGAPRIRSADAPIRIRAKVAARVGHGGAMKAAQANESRPDPELKLRPSTSE